MASTLSSSFVGARVHSARAAVRGNQAGLKFNKGAAVVTMRKKDIHPEYFEEATVICNGEEVMKVGGTQANYTVDIWSGNHPFFNGVTGTVVTNEDRVNRFKSRYAGLESISTVTTANEAAKKKAEE